MAGADWAIVFVMAGAAIGGMAQGFFRSACSLGGLLIGLALAAWNYGRAAAPIFRMVHTHAVADTIAFLLVALATMAVFAVIGAILAKAFRWMGLGCLDTVAGGLFGLLQGALLVTLGILAIVAFFPQAQWLADAKLPKMFFGACHLSTHMSPDELARRVREGLRLLEHESPRWMHPNSNPS